MNTDILMCFVLICDKEPAPIQRNDFARPFKRCRVAIKDVNDKVIFFISAQQIMRARPAQWTWDIVTSTLTHIGGAVSPAQPGQKSQMREILRSSNSSAIPRLPLQPYKLDFICGHSIHFRQYTFRRLKSF